MKPALRVGLLALAVAAAFGGGALTAACQIRGQRDTGLPAAVVGSSPRAAHDPNSPGALAAAVLLTPFSTAVRGATKCAK